MHFPQGTPSGFINLHSTWILNLQATVAGLIYAAQLSQGFIECTFPYPEISKHPWQCLVASPLYVDFFTDFELDDFFRIDYKYDF